MTHRMTVLLLGLLVTTAAAEPGPIERRPGDERLFLVPTPLAMRPGAVSLSDDEVVSARLAVGVARHLQLDLRIGGLPIPGAIGGALPFPGGLAAGGGAGFVLLGLVDLGVKVPLVLEDASTPGVAVGYDLVDAFGIAAGGAGIAFAGAGAAAGGIVAVGGANLQFNLFSLSVGKHIGRTQLVAGSYLLDNHHFLPQSAHFTSACGAGGVGGAGEGGKAEPCASGGTTIDRIPLQVQPFVAVEQRIGTLSSLAGELLLASHAKNLLGTTGVRWIVGPPALRGRIDIALMWTSRGYPLPWLGVGAHFR